MCYKNEIGQTELGNPQGAKSNQQTAQGSYVYPIFLISNIRYEGYKDYQYYAHINKIKQMNYNFNPGLFKGQVFKESTEMNQSPSSLDHQLLYADFNKMRHGNNKQYRNDIQSILKSSHINKYDRIREVLRDEMWNRSRIKTTKINYYTPSYDDYQKVKSVNPISNKHEKILSAKDLLLPQLPLIKKLSGKIGRENNNPFVTNINDKVFIENKDKKACDHKVALSEPTSNSIDNNSLKERIKKKELKQIDTNATRDLKIKTAIKSFTQKDNNDNEINNNQSKN